MLPAALLRRPGLGRLVRQARAYAEAAAAPAPAAGPGQMSFTFASPTQVRTSAGLETPFWTPRPSPVWPRIRAPNPQVGDPHCRPAPLPRVVRDLTAQLSGRSSASHFDVRPSSRGSEPESLGTFLVRSSPGGSLVLP